MPSALDIKLEIQLDQKHNPSFFPGDPVMGKIFFTANRNYSLCDFRLAWTGRIQVQPIQTNKETRIYFDEYWKLGSNTAKAANKIPKGSSNVPYYISELISTSHLQQQQQEQPKIELQKNKPVGLTFQVRVPNDRPLPSCTEIGTHSPNKIMYLLEAFIDEQVNGKPVFFAQRMVPVYECIYTRIPEMIMPQRAEQAFMVSLFSEQQRELTTSAMRVTLPCRGSQPGIAIPVSISIWNNSEFARKQGISISLFRINQILANGRTYTSQGENVHRIVTDLNITSENSNDGRKMQTVRVGLPIPKGTPPTIGLEQSQLMSISYYIRVQVFAQEGVYVTPEGKESRFMTVDLPFVIGTQTSPSTPASPTLSNSISPISSPQSIHTTTTATTGTTTATFSPTSPTSPRYSFDTSLTNGIAASMEVSDTASIVTAKSSESSKKNSIINSIFRKPSNGSTTSGSSQERKKKKSVFSSLRLSNHKSTAAVQQDQSQDDDVSPAAVITTTAPIMQSEQTNDANSGGGVFDLFAGDNLDDDDDIPKNYKTECSNDGSAAISQCNKAGGVFQMFPDDDDSSIEESMLESATAVTSSSTAPKVFQMFADEDTSSDEEESIVAELTVSTAAIVLNDSSITQRNAYNTSSESEQDEFDLLRDLARKG